MFTTDTKQYLDFRSHHPHHVKVSLPYNLARRICTIVSEEDVRFQRLNEMGKFLKICNYPDNLIDDGIKKSLSIRRDVLLKCNSVEKNKSNIVHVSTYHQNYNDNNCLIRSTFKSLQNNETTSHIFNSKNLIIAKRQPPNLKNILTKAKLSSKYDNSCVSKCNLPRCQLCSIIIEGSSFHFQKTNTYFTVKSSMDCNTLNCIYVLKCTGCPMIYIGETKNLRLRTNLHRDHANKNTGLGVSKHFFNCNLTSGENKSFLIMPFYKLDHDDDFFRKNMETHFIKKYKPELNAIS